MPRRRHRDRRRPASSRARIALNGPLGDLRRYSSAVNLPLEEVEQICRSFDVTINDVALSAVADSYRSGLLRRVSSPEPILLRTLVPVSVWPPGAMDAAGNRVSLMLPYLPVDVADPLQRLRVVHERLQTAKAAASVRRQHFVRATNLLPFALTAWTVRLLARLPQRSIVTVVTTSPVPTASHPDGSPGGPVLPIPPIAADFRTGIAIFSYADEISFGLLVDFDAAPDVDELAAGVRSGVDRLAALALLHPAELLSRAIIARTRADSSSSRRSAAATSVVPDLRHPDSPRPT